MNIRNRRAWMRSTVATGACLVFALPLAASAQTVHRHDPAHDVVLYTYSETFKKAPTNKTADIKAATFRHTRARVMATIRLRHYGGGEWDWMEVITTRTQWYFLWGEKESGHPLDLQITRGEQETPFTCKGLAATIRPARNTIRVSVPRACLHRPRWVRLSLLYEKYSLDKGFYMDDALRTGFSEEHPFGETRRIYAG